jgi:hypothetical protein
LNKSGLKRRLYCPKAGLSTTIIFTFFVVFNHFLVLYSIPRKKKFSWFLTSKNNIKKPKITMLNPKPDTQETAPEEGSGHSSPSPSPSPSSASFFNPDTKEETVRQAIRRYYDDLEDEVPSSSDPEYDAIYHFLLNNYSSVMKQSRSRNALIENLKTKIPAILNRLKPRPIDIDSDPEEGRSDDEHESESNTETKKSDHEEAAHKRKNVHFSEEPPIVHTFEPDEITDVDDMVKQEMRKYCKENHLLFSKNEYNAVYALVLDFSRIQIEADHAESPEEMLAIVQGYVANIPTPPTSTDHSSGSQELDSLLASISDSMGPM